MTLIAVDGPALLKLTVAVTVPAARAMAGAVIVDDTSANGEIAVAALVVSGCVFGPWLVDVPIVLLTFTEPLGGAV